MQCEGWRRKGGAFTFGPVTWKQCENDAIVNLIVTQDNKTETLPACAKCLKEARGSKMIAIEDVIPVASQDKEEKPTHLKLNQIAKGVAMTEAYAIEGLYYCEMCFLELFVDLRDDWAHDLITENDFPDRPVPCEYCATEDVFDRVVCTTLDLSDESWLISWPTEPGHYWFHGWEYGDDGSSPKTFLVEVFRTILNEPVYLVEGHVIRKSEACGVWRPQPVELPVPPQTPKGEVK